MSQPLMPCGTYAAHQRHLANGEPSCRACKDANNEYRRLLRGRGIPTTDRLKENARKRAQARLAHAFPDEFKALFDEEVAKAIAAERAVA